MKHGLFSGSLIFMAAIALIAIVVTDQQKTFGAESSIYEKFGFGEKYTTVYEATSKGPFESYTPIVIQAGAPINATPFGPTQNLKLLTNFFIAPEKAAGADILHLYDVTDVKNESRLALIQALLTSGDDFHIAFLAGTNKRDVRRLPPIFFGTPVKVQISAGAENVDLDLYSWGAEETGSAWERLVEIMKTSLNTAAPKAIELTFDDEVRLFIATSESISNVSEIGRVLTYDARAFPGWSK